MEKEKQVNKVDKIDPEYIKMYFEHQYDRLARLELLAFAFTNIIVAPLSGIILAIGFHKTEFIPRRYDSSVLLFVGVLNILAIAYIIRTCSQAQSHRRRAKKILEKYAKEVFLLDMEMAPIAHQDDFFINIRKYGQWIIQLLLHILLLLACVWLMIS